MRDIDLEIIIALSQARQNAKRFDVSKEIDAVLKGIDLLGSVPANYGTSHAELEELRIQGLQSTVALLNRRLQAEIGPTYMDNVRKRLQKIMSQLDELVDQCRGPQLVLFPNAD